jgi:hypothetical protein
MPEIDKLIATRIDVMLHIEGLLEQYLRITDYAEKAAIIAGLTELRTRLADLQNEIADMQLKAVQLAKPLKKNVTGTRS